MEPIIDSLGCMVDMMELRDGHFDMATKKIYGRSLQVDSVTAAYIYPLVGNGTSTDTSTDSVTAVESDLWTITADSLRLTAAVVFMHKKVLDRLKVLTLLILKSVT